MHTNVVVIYKSYTASKYETLGGWGTSQPNFTFSPEEREQNKFIPEEGSHHGPEGPHSPSAFYLTGVRLQGECVVVTAKGQNVVKSCSSTDPRAENIVG